MISSLRENQKRKWTLTVKGRNLDLFYVFINKYEVLKDKKLIQKYTDIISSH